MNFEDQLKQFKNELVEEFNLQAPEEQDHLSPYRVGKFTGSGIKKLMTCKSRSTKTDWSMREKIVDFGDTALNYCLEKAVERITDKRVEFPSTWEMQWGTNHEPIAREEIFKQYGIVVPEQDFMFFMNNSGSTPDSFFEEFKEMQNVNVEIKCPPKMLNHAKYLSEQVDESHEYFWQIQDEMMGQSVFRKIDCNKTAFFSYHPYFSDETKLGCTIVEASEIHQIAIKIRCIIGERIIQGLISDRLLKMPHTYIKDAIEDIPSDYNELIIWFNEEIKKYEPVQQVL